MGTGNRKQDEKEDRRARREVRARAQLAERVSDIDDAIQDPQFSDSLITEIRFRVTHDAGSDVLVIVKRGDVGSKEIAFHGGGNFTDCVRDIGRRLRDDDLKWREDKPYEAR